MYSRLILLPFLLWLHTSCQSIEAQEALQQPAPNAIQVNQVGYPTSGPKSAAILGVNKRGFHLLTEVGDTVFSGITGPEQIWEATDQWAAKADFSRVSTPGFFMLVVDGIGDREEILISDDPYGMAAQKMIKSLYFQRASTELKSPYAEN